MRRQAMRQGFCLRGPQQARNVFSQILPSLPNLPPSRTSALALSHMIPVLVCTTWISTSMSIWASQARMRMRKG